MLLHEEILTAEEIHDSDSSISDNAGQETSVYDSGIEQNMEKEDE